jgi:hypothetical protein
MKIIVALSMTNAEGQFPSIIFDGMQDAAYTENPPALVVYDAARNKRGSIPWEKVLYVTYDDYGPDIVEAPVVIGDPAVVEAPVVEAPVVVLKEEARPDPALQRRLDALANMAREVGLREDNPGAVMDDDGGKPYESG